MGGKINNQKIVIKTINFSGCSPCIYGFSPWEYEPHESSGHRATDRDEEKESESAGQPTSWQVRQREEL